MFDCVVLKYPSHDFSDVYKIFFDESLVVPLSTLCAEFQLKNLHNKRMIL